MNTAELKAERVRKDKSVDYMANLIGKSYGSYRKKENGDVKFDPDEMVAIAYDLELDFEKFNVIFFDGQLPFSNNDIGKYAIVM